MGQSTDHAFMQTYSPSLAEADVPEMVDRAVHAEERQDKGTGPAVTLPDEVAARVPRLAQPFLCNGSVQLAMVPPAKRLENWSVRDQQHIAGEASHRHVLKTERKLVFSWSAFHAEQPEQSSLILLIYKWPEYCNSDDYMSYFTCPSSRIWSVWREKVKLRGWICKPVYDR